MVLEQRFNKSMTNICKGIAIILMIVHHLFPDMEGYGLKVGNIWLINQMAILGKICVPMYLFLSGFGLEESYKKKPLKICEFLKRRFLSIYVEYWLIFIIFMAMGYFCFRNVWLMFAEAPYGVINNLILNFFGIQYFVNGYMGINPSWWFISEIVLLYLLFPIFHKAVDRKIGYYIVVVLFLLTTFLRESVQFGMITINIIYIAPFMMGVLFSKKNLVEGIEGRLHCWQVMIPWVIVIAGLTIWFIMMGLNSYHGMQIGVFLAPMYCISIFCLAKFVKNYNELSKSETDPILRQVSWFCTPLMSIMEFLGKYSYGIYLIHLFITNMYFTPYIYSLNSPFFMVGITVVWSLAYAIVISWIRNIVFKALRFKR